MKNILVSVCCITYNHALYIRDCIDGFLMQKTNFPIEILIHDDASTDGTSKIIKEYENKYPEIIKAIYQTDNQFSKGIDISVIYQFPRAKGKYIALCEGDDYWIDPLKLQKQVDFLEANPEYGMISSDNLLVDENGCILPDDWMVIKQRELRKPEPDFFELMNCNAINTPSVCVRANLLKELSEIVSKEKLWFVYDYWFWLNISLKHNINVTFDQSVAYRMHQNGISKVPGYLSSRLPFIKHDVIMRFIATKNNHNAKEYEKLLPHIMSLLINKHLDKSKKIKLLKLMVKAKMYRKLPTYIMGKLKYKWTMK